MGTATAATAAGTPTAARRSRAVQGLSIPVTTMLGATTAMARRDGLLATLLGSSARLLEELLCCFLYEILARR